MTELQLILFMSNVELVIGKNCFAILSFVMNECHLSGQLHDDVAACHLQNPISCILSQLERGSNTVKFFSVLTLHTAMTAC